MKKYTNRYGDEFTFELNERGNIQWSGEFKHCRFVGNDTITMIDPSGGPYISSEMDMGEFGFDGKIVNGFIPNKDGYEIVVEKGRIPYRYYKEMLKETFNTKEK